MTLTDFICNMLAAPPGTAAKADPVRLAAKYGLPVETVAGYLKLNKGE